MTSSPKRKRTRFADEEERSPKTFHVLFYCIGDNGLLHFVLDSDTPKPQEVFDFTVKELTQTDDDQFAQDFRRLASKDVPRARGVWKVERLDGQDSIFNRTWSGSTHVQVVTDLCAEE